MDDEKTIYDEIVQKKKRIPLRSLAQVRKYLARVIRDFETDSRRAAKVQEYRCKGFLAGKLIEAFTAEKIEVIEARLAILERQAEVKDARH